jgi:hypothetical protein
MATKKAAAKKTVAKKTAAKKAPTKKAPSKKSPLQKTGSPTKAARPKTAEATTQSDVIDFDSVLIKPDWKSQAEIETRPLWEVVALSMGVKPTSGTTKLISDSFDGWRTSFNERIVLMREKLSDQRKKGFIFADTSMLMNKVWMRTTSKHKYVRVDVPSAISVAAEIFGRNALPREFLELQSKLQTKFLTQKTNESPSVEQVQLSPPKKSQEKRNETVASKVLMKLLYVVVENYMGGWSKANANDRQKILSKFIDALNLHSMESRYAMSDENIEEYLDEGMKLAPLNS